jgi:hypothetical protein
MRHMRNKVLLAALTAFASVGCVLGSAVAQATDALPSCPAYRMKNDNGGVPGNLPLNNEQVLKWKTTTQNTFVDRGHVKGEIVAVYDDRNGHEHFSLKIGPNPTDTVEIVFNQNFGKVPDPKPGMPVEACGDYITSTGPSPAPGGETYPASPDGALVHWVHSATHGGHNSGYLMVNGVLTGQGFKSGSRSDHSSGPDFDRR